jgi:hypothetical protein
MDWPSVLVQLIAAVLGVTELLPRNLPSFDSPQRRERLLCFLERAFPSSTLPALNSA